MEGFGTLRLIQILEQSITVDFIWQTIQGSYFQLLSNVKYIVNLAWGEFGTRCSPEPRNMFFIEKYIWDTSTKFYAWKDTYRRKNNQNQEISTSYQFKELKLEGSH